MNILHLKLQHIFSAGQDILPPIINFIHHFINQHMKNVASRSSSDTMDPVKPKYFKAMKAAPRTCIDLLNRQIGPITESSSRTNTIADNSGLLESDDDDSESDSISSIENENGCPSMNSSSESEKARTEPGKSLKASESLVSSDLLHSGAQFQSQNASPTMSPLTVEGMGDFESKSTTAPFLTDNAPGDHLFREGANQILTGGNGSPGNLPCGPPLHVRYGSNTYLAPIPMPAIPLLESEWTLPSDIHKSDDGSLGSESDIPIVPTAGSDSIAEPQENPLFPHHFPCATWPYSLVNPYRHQDSSSKGYLSPPSSQSDHGPLQSPQSKGKTKDIAVATYSNVERNLELASRIPLPTNSPASWKRLELVGAGSRKHLFRAKVSHTEYIKDGDSASKEGVGTHTSFSGDWPDYNLEEWCDRLLASWTNSDDKNSNGDSRAPLSQNGLDRSDSLCEHIDYGKKIEALLPLEGQVNQGLWPPLRVFGTRHNEDTEVILKSSIENRSQLESIKKEERNRNKNDAVENSEDESDGYRLLPAEWTCKKSGSKYSPEQSAPSLDDERSSFKFSRIMPAHYDERSMYPFTNHPSQEAALSLIKSGPSLDEYGAKFLSLFPTILTRGFKCCSQIFHLHGDFMKHFENVREVEDLAVHRAAQKSLMLQITQQMQKIKTIITEHRTSTLRISQQMQKLKTIVTQRRTSTIDVPETPGGPTREVPGDSNSEASDSMPDLIPASPSEEDIMYDIELNSNDLSQNSDDEEWIKVCRQRDSEDTQENEERARRRSMSQESTELHDSMEDSEEDGGVRIDTEEFEELIDSWVDV
jgi:hypothetical protein